MAAQGEARETAWAAAMRAALAGDEAAYRRLLGEIGRAIRPAIRAAFARSRAGDGDIEDVVQETLLAIHLKRQTWDPTQKLTPWVYAIARHKAIDALRRRGVRRRSRSRISRPCSPPRRPPIRTSAPTSSG